MKFLPILILLILLLFPFVVQAQAVAALQQLIRNIGNVLMGIGGGLAVLVIIIGGFAYLTAGGSEDRIGKAKKIIVNGLVGAAIIIGSGFIIGALIEVIAPLAP